MRDALAARAADFTALGASAELSSCGLDQSASVIHRWLRQHAPHDAVAITVKGSDEPLSQWASPAIETLSRPVVAASGVVAATEVTITVALRPGRSPLTARAERVLQALARVLAARVSRTPPATDTAKLSIAHAMSLERSRLTRELAEHFAHDLETILGHLRDDATREFADRIHRATSEATRALQNLRERRTLWQQARRIDEAFAVVERETGDIARAGGVRLEGTLVGPPQRIVSNTVLDAAASITHAAVRNVLQDAEASRARVSWSLADDQLVISVVDDGRGFDARHEGPHGLRAMRRRAEGLGGAVQIESVAGWGTHLQAWLRLHAASAVEVDESAGALVRTLGDREFDVLRLLAVGHRNREIAAALGLSPHTVKFHVAKILEKLCVRTRAEATAVAFAAGIRPRPRLVASPTDD